MKLKLTLSFAKLLKSVNEADVNAGSVTGINKKLLTMFIQDSVLDYRIIGKQHKKIFCPDTGNLARYLHHKFEIPDLSNYIDFLEKESVERSDAARAVSDTKFRKTKVFTGFLLNCFERLECELNSNRFVVSPVAGSFTFIAAYQHFKIPSDVTVVVVEGHENFREIERQRYLFQELNVLFVWRYQNSSAITAWLNMIPNNYLHFGDFDPKRIHIYLSEFKNKISGTRGTFLVPSNIEELLAAHGEKELYEKQKQFIPLIRKSADEALLPLIDLIVRMRKGLAQEILIR